MVALQNAYSVNARVISTVQAMWEALFGAVR
jgi:flagellar hook-associated protein FlgK